MCLKLCGLEKDCFTVSVTIAIETETSSMENETRSSSLECKQTVKSTMLPWWASLCLRDYIFFLFDSLHKWLEMFESGEEWKEQSLIWDCLQSVSYISVGLATTLWEAIICVCVCLAVDYSITEIIFIRHLLYGKRRDLHALPLVCYLSIDWAKAVALPSRGLCLVLRQLLLCFIYWI